MREIASTVIENGVVCEQYAVTEDRRGDVVITCSVPDADVFRPDSFHVPADLRTWLSKAIAPVRSLDPGIALAATAIRAFAERAKTEMPTISAQDALQMVATMLDGGANRQPGPGAKVIPIRGWIEDERVTLSDIKVIPLRPGCEQRIWP